MKAIPYFQQLKHPKWQKLRLEMLEAANWRCESCCSEDKTLHVHHRQYIKGRMAWEYESSNFDVLCDSCHEHTHASRDVINHFLSLEHSNDVNGISSLLCGYYQDVHDVDEFLGFMYDEQARLAGEVAGLLRDWHIDEIETLINFIRNNGVEKTVDALGAAELSRVVQS